MGGQPLPLPVWDRRAGVLTKEFMDDHPATYDSTPRRSLTQWLESKPIYDWLLAAYQNSRWSARKIAPFIREHHIDMSPFKPVEYRSYAEFFDREFLPDVRTFPAEPHAMGAFAEARYFGWQRLTEEQSFPVKGHSLCAKDILGAPERAEGFLGGPVILARLSPMDYHHVHYPDDGATLEEIRLGRRLWTVNWHALLNQSDILFDNERQIQLLDTVNFGLIGFVEVGAMSVGRIAQVHPTDISFTRGAEKSVFKFGGSAVVVFGEAGKWSPSEDILEHTKDGVETLVRLGEPIATRIDPPNQHGARQRFAKASSFAAY
jgi:phosphatidylserine decarboxylase